MVRIHLAKPPTSHGQSKNKLQGDIAQFDRGAAPFPEKIRIAFDVLGLDDEALIASHDGDSHAPESSVFYARDELVLRWILDSQQAPGDLGSSARLDPKSWHLTFHLIRRLPLATSAILLISHHFLNILDTTLSEAINTNPVIPSFERQENRKECNDRQAVVEAGDENSGSQISESSATIIDSPHLAPISNPRKRKRNNSSSKLHSPAERPERALDISNLLFSILRVVELILALAVTHSTEVNCKGETDHCSRAYMRSVLRGTPDLAARILGNWFKMLRHVIGTCDGGSDALLRCGSSACLTPIIQIWSSQCFDPSDGIGYASKIFANHCSVPALLLLYESKMYVEHATTTLDVSRLIEALLSQYLFLPARAEFLNQRSAPSGIRRKETKSGTPLTLSELLIPLQQEMSQSHDSEASFSSRRATPANISLAIPLLFDIAVKCSLQSETKRRRLDAPWINHVLITLAGFDELARPHYARFVPESTKSGLVERMLDIAIANEIVISSDALQSILVQFSGLLHGTVGEVRWNLLDNVSKIDADVFISSQDGHRILSGRKTDDHRVLDLLFAQITEVSSEGFVGEADARYSLALAIVLRLLHAFTRERNLVGFISAWEKQLEFIEHGRASLVIGGVQKEFTFSLWEDEDLLLATTALLWSSLSPTQIKELLRVSEANIARSIDLEYNLERHIKAFASLIALDAIFSGIDQDVAIGTLWGSINLVYSTLIRLVSSVSSLKSHERRMWRIISRIREFWQANPAASIGLDPSLSYNSATMVTGSVEQDMQTVLETALERASSAVRKGLRRSKSPKVHPRSYFNAFLAFDLILCMSESPGLTKTTQASEGVTLKALDRSFKALLDCLSRLGADAGLERPTWNGRFRDLRSEPVLAMAFTARLVLHSPKVLLYLPQASRRRLLHLLHGRASVGFQGWSHRRSEARQIRFERIWEGIFCGRDFLSHPDLKDDVIETLIDCVGETDPEAIKPVADGRDAEASAISSLSVLSLELFKREQRERILNVLLMVISHTKNESEIPSEALCGRLSLMSKLMDVPNASAAVATNPEALLDLADIISRCTQIPGALATRVLGDIVRKNLGHLIPTKDQERSRQYIHTFFQSLGNRLSNATTLEHHLGFLQIISSSIQVMWSHHTAMTTDIFVLLENIREKYLHILLSDLQNWLQRLNRDRHRISAFLKAAVDALVEFPDLGSMGTGDEVAVVVKTLLETTDQHVPYLLQVTRDGADEVAERAKSVLFGVLRAALLDLTKTTDAAILSISLLRMSGSLASLPEEAPAERCSLGRSDRNFILTNFRDLTKSLESEEKVSLLSYLLKETLDSADNGGWTVLLLKVFVSAIENPGSLSSDICKVISGLYSKLCRKLCQARNLREFCLVVDTMDLIVRRKPWAINQWNIDETLGSLASAASSSGPQINSRNCGVIYLRLCQNVKGILAVHRLKLKGRFHLLVPLMQNLLRCLFLRKGARELKPNSKSPLPPWLSPQGEVCAAPYAIAFARLLSMLCDPTTASVSTTSNRHRQELTPATAKAREIAGLHLPYLLMEYIQCQLRYHLLPDVKSALTPGLYAMLGVMSQETLRMVNSAMDASGRALFKVLYSDYGRYGKWDEA